jgi:hypothetical protein
LQPDYKKAVVNYAISHLKFAISLMTEIDTAVIQNNSGDRDYKVEHQSIHKSTGNSMLL